MDQDVNCQLQSFLTAGHASLPWWLQTPTLWNCKPQMNSYFYVFFVIVFYQSNRNKTTCHPIWDLRAWVVETASSGFKERPYLKIYGRSWWKKSSDIHSGCPHGTCVHIHLHPSSSPTICYTDIPFFDHFSGILKSSLKYNVLQIVSSSILDVEQYSIMPVWM